MEFIATLIIVPVTLLIRSKIFILLLIGIIAYQLIYKKSLKSMYHHVLAYLIAISLIIGVPYGLAKTIVPEAQGAEKQILEEVAKWKTF
jgi:uncharacterized protein YqhQ